MHTVFDHQEIVATCKEERGVHVHGDAKRVLQQENARTRRDATLCICQIDVVVLQTAVHVDGPCACVAYCIGHYHV